MKRSLWLLMLFLLAGHVPAASADSACEGRFVNPITDICWSCIFPLSLGSIKVSQGMLYALAAGFLAAASLSPLCEIIFGGVRIFLLKRRMRRENTLREGSNNASH